MPGSTPTPKHYWRRSLAIGILLFLALAAFYAVTDQCLIEAVRYRKGDGFQRCIVFQNGSWLVAPRHLHTMADVPRVEADVRLSREERGWPLIVTRTWTAEIEGKTVTPWGDAVDTPDFVHLLIDDMRDHVSNGRFAEFAPLVESRFKVVELSNPESQVINRVCSAAVRALPLLPIYTFIVGFIWVVLRKRKRKGHCRDCGYDLTGLSSMRCPECGHGGEGATRGRLG
jgi:hypothetical protein